VHVNFLVLLNSSLPERFMLSGSISQNLTMMYDTKTLLTFEVFLMTEPVPAFIVYNFT